MTFSIVSAESIITCIHIIHIFIYPPLIQFVEIREITVYNLNADTELRAIFTHLKRFSNDFSDSVSFSFWVDAVSSHINFGKHALLIDFNNLDLVWEPTTLININFKNRTCT